jgi:hypothetical protein
MKLIISFHVKISTISFQDSIIIALCLGKCFKVLIKDRFELDEYIDVSDKITIEEETNFLNSDTEFHYVTHYRKLRKYFLNYLEISMTHDS